MTLDMQGIRYYLKSKYRNLYYAGDGEWSINYNDRYFYYVNPVWMVISTIEIVAEDYATD